MPPDQTVIESYKMSQNTRKEKSLTRLEVEFSILMTINEKT